MKYLTLPLVLVALTACLSKDDPAPTSPDAKPKSAAPTSKPSTPAATTPAKASHVNAMGAADLLKAEPATVVLDIRTPAEYAAGHLQGAVNIDYKASDFAANVGKLDKSKKYLVHCHSGGRSSAALPILEKLGFQSVVHLDGGIAGWTKAEQPVVK